MMNAAEKIMTAHNRAVKRGLGGNGKLVFDSDGNGGAWYSNNSRIAGDYIVFPVGWTRVTARGVQEFLDSLEQQ